MTWWMKKRVLLLAFLTAIALCPAGNPGAAEKGVVIKAGGTGGALGGMKQVARAFEKKHPGVTISFAPSLGSNGGIKAVLAGSINLALSARPLSDDERKFGAGEVEYARTPFIFVTSRKGKRPSLTLRQVAAIYAGETKTWPDGAPIRLILRPAGDADTALLRSMSPEMDAAVLAALSREGMVAAVTDQENADIIGRIRGGFGASTLAQLLAERRPLKALSLDGVEPGLAALARGAYPYSKTFFAIAGPKASRGTRDFIAFLHTAEARAILTRTGHLAPHGMP